MKYSRFVIALLFVVLLFSSAFSQELDRPLRVGWIMESQGLGDRGFNDMVDEALSALAREGTIEVIRTPRLDLLTDKAIANLLALGVDVVITSDESGMAAAVSEAARSHPDVRFILLGVEGAPLTNLASVLFEEHEAGYMAGYIAGALTETGIVAFIGGGTFDPILRYERGFMAGVADGNASAEVLTEYLSRGNDSSGLYNAKINEETSRKLAGMGSDVIFCAAGSGSTGAVLGANRMEVFAIGLQNDQRHLAPETVATSVVYRFDVAVNTVLSDILDGNFWGGTYVMGFQEGGLDITGFSKTVGSAAVRKIKSRKALLEKGSIDVPDYLDERRRTTIVVSHNIDMPPYEYVDKDGESVGFLIDVMTDVGRRLGREVLFKSYFGTRIESGLEAKRSDVSPMIMVDEDRVRTYLFSQPWGVAESVMVVAEGDFSPQDISELITKNVGAAAGTVEERFVQKIPGVFPVGYTTTELALMALARNDVDAVIANREVVYYFLSQKPLSKEDLIALGKPILISPYAVAMAQPGNHDFLLEVENQIKAMKSDGTLMGLAHKWFGSSHPGRVGVLKRLFD
jgi:basic membrane protein A